MKYSDLISSILNKIRESRAWPEDASVDKLGEQLDLVFGAALAVARELPLPVFRGAAGSEETTEQQGLFGEYKEFDLPADRFAIRPDQGITHVILSTDGFTRKRYEAFESLLRHQSIRESNGSPWQKNNPMFRLDLAAGIVAVSGVETFQLEYVPVFERPTEENYEELDFPLPPPYDSQVVNLTAMEVEAVLTGNRSKGAVHKALSDFYGSPAPAATTQGG